MNIIVKKAGIGAGSRVRPRYGIWGIVLKSYADTHTVDVQLATGQEVLGVPVATGAWVTSDLGEKNLPPVDARVFIFMPTGTIEESFVLCSGYSAIETHPVLEGSENDKHYIGQTGLEYKNEDGNILLSNPDGEGSITLDKLTLNIGEQTVTIDENGVSIESDSEIKLKASDAVIEALNAQITGGTVKH